MNAWRNELGNVRVQSIALPRDGGVLNPSTKNRYRCDATDLAATFRREKRRIAEALRDGSPAESTSTPKPVAPAGAGAQVIPLPIEGACA